METENDIIPRIAGAFAGGIGNTGAVCGAALTDALPKVYRAARFRSLSAFGLSL